jgi:RNA polymerase-binding protein DksA
MEQLSKELMEEFKTKLLEEKKNLEEELGKFAKPIGNDEYETKMSDMGSDEDENASEVEEYADNLALENTLEKRMDEVNEALLKIENGTYGFCDNCGKMIDIERLRAYPAAKICIKCDN